MLQVAGALVPNGALPAGTSMPLLQEGEPATAPDSYQVTPASGVCFTEQCMWRRGDVLSDIAPAN